MTPATVIPAAGQGATTGHYAIVDTGQTTCYDNQSAITCPTAGTIFYGQDAQFSGKAPSYTLSADGLTVTDNVTGLTWTQSPDLNGDGTINVTDKLTFADAQRYADAELNPQTYGGYSDWRLPTMKELYSLMDFRGTDPSGPGTSAMTPFIDTNTFDFGYGDEAAGERAIDAQFWSNNLYLGTVFGNQTCAFGLNLADGRIKCYPSETNGPPAKLNYIYFVRGNPAYGLNAFSDNGDGTVTDHATGLTWSQDDSGAGMNWAEALAWAQQKNAENYLGHSDWRLPSAKEMQSLLDYDQAPDATNSAAIDPVFNISQITNEAGQVDYPWFWTSTTHLKSNGSGSDGVYLSFGRALGYMHNTWLDVHGAGAQRSDPKTGDPADWPTGHGPQGDAIRIDNYVRLVRAGQVSLTMAGDPSASQAGQINRVAPDEQAGPPAGPQNGPPNGAPPPEAIEACTGQSQGASCQFTAPRGQITGTCAHLQQQVACVPAGGPPN
ncbi:MAG: DUF1566 domain-containing protein [Anaerolineae bacterium]|nr:DUF1566 domain-containing protein [Anaerolineae bacterium]